MVEIGDTVRIHCTGRLDDGSCFCDSRRAGQPIEFTVGSQMLLAALEEAVIHMEPGDARTLRIPAEKAYGAYDESLLETIPSAQFPEWENLPVGGYIEMRTGVGSMRVRVDFVDEEVIRFDHNHELAGRDLEFDIELMEILKSDAIAQEAHAAECGCGCQRLKASLQS
ncbi:FKBP-type peptidyl-prolyl cis-trans isomerase [Adlercreutzia murintestinalis]|uniref:FKBP-type peptidyl-prolyl cis-trans isomerase n=1 Tax=Adlercreutzia murintestinalis TaxID=2941325 RepID=UPI0032E43A6F